MSLPVDIDLDHLPSGAVRRIDVQQPVQVPDDPDRALWAARAHALASGAPPTRRGGTP